MTWNFESRYSDSQSSGSAGWPEGPGSGGASRRDGDVATDLPAIDLGVARAPYPWLGAAAGAALLGLLLAGVGGGLAALAIIGWVLSGPLAIVLLGAFSIRDARERAKPVYDDVALTRVLYATVLIVALSGVVVAALRIADWAGRL